MSNNAYISYVNLADSSTLSASTSQLLMPISNLKVPHVGRRWRGNTVGGDYFVSDLGSLTTMDTLAVFGISSGTQIRFRVSSVDATGAAGDLYDSGTLAVDQSYDASIIVMPSVSGRYVRVDIVATTYAEAGRLFVGVRTQFSYNFVKGWSRMWNDRSVKTKTRGGQTQIYKDNSFRTVDVTFDFLTQADRDGFVEAIDRDSGLSSDVLFITNPASTNLARDSIWGLISSPTPVVQPSVLTFSKQYHIEERL